MMENHRTIEPTRLLLRPEEVAQALGIGRSQAYSLLSSGEIESIRIGRSRRVPVEALERWLEEVRGSQRP